MINVKNVVVSGIVALALVGCGKQTAEKVDTRFVEPVEYHLRHYPVDQVFRDHDGWRVYLTLGENKQVRELKFYDESNENFLPRIEEKDRFTGLRTETADSNVMVYRDVKAGERPYVEMVRFITSPRSERAEKFRDRINLDKKYVEIHLSEDSKMGAGNETYGGKYKHHADMEEVK